MKRNFYSTGLLLCLIGLPIASAQAESVVLSSGFRIQADRHESDGKVVRVFQGVGFVEIPASTIAAFEADEFAPAKPLLAPIPQPVAVPPAFPTAPVPITARELAVAAARKYGLPETFVRSVMHAESNFRANALSPKGAIGLMQLMESTAKRLGVDPKIPQENAEGGARYLRELLARYEHDPNQVVLALAAYNAGPEAVERYHGVPPFRETREYIVRVLRDWDRKAVQ